MANSKISALTSATTPLAGTETLPIVQSSTTKQVSVANLTAGRAISVSGMTVTGLTASNAVATDASKNLVSVANTGSGNNVLSSSPTGGGNWTISGVYDVNQSNGWYITNGENQSGGTGFGVSLRLTSDSGGNYDGRIVNVVGGTIYNSLIFQSANVKIDTGNLIIGTSGKGIDFSANTPAAGMTSQLLNWYEQGTWTPSPTNLTVIGTPSYTGTYVRIGRVVYIILEVAASTSTASTANSTYFTGLPFTIAIDSVINSVGANAVTSPGSGLITKFSGGRIYTPTWGATGTIELSGFYFV